ncbi:hypothetical protein ACFFJ4_21270, partial [Xanthomonas dyei]
RSKRDSPERCGHSALLGLVVQTFPNAQMTIDGNACRPPGLIRPQRYSAAATLLTLTQRDPMTGIR